MTSPAVLDEPTQNPHLVIRPTRTEDGRYTGSWALVHLPTGKTVVGQRSGPQDWREVATRIAHLDWATDDLTVLAGHRATVWAALKAVAQTEPTAAEQPTTEEWGVRLPRAATPMLAMFLDEYQKHGDNLAPGMSDEEFRRSAQWQVNLFTYFYLLAALQRLDPEIAESAAAQLADQWAAGEDMGELMGQWRQELEAGQPLTLPGIPTAIGELPVLPTADLRKEVDSHLINQPQRYARIHIQPRPGVDSWPVVERVHGGWQSGEHHYPDDMVLDVKPLPIMPAAEKLVLEAGWVCVDTGRHTCGGGGPETNGMHEPGCGLEPLINLKELPVGRAQPGTEFAALPDCTACGGNGRDRAAVEAWYQSTPDLTEVMAALGLNSEVGPDDEDRQPVPAASVTSEAVNRVVRGLEREGDGHLFLTHEGGRWGCVVTFGREDPDSPMAAGAAHGVAGTAAEALQKAVTETGWT